MQKITPHLWFDTQAKEATAFYATVFPDSEVKSIRTITGTPSGDCDIVSFRLWGMHCMAISAGPYFTCNPSISFMVNFDPSSDPNAEEHIRTVWEKISEGGKILMPFGEYPFSKQYGWVEDRYGVSWQLILTNPAGEARPPIMPSLLFVGDVCGKAEEASDFYLSVFKDSARGIISRYPSGMEPDKEGTVMFTDFRIGGQWFIAMDSAHKHEFAFNEAISFIVKCDSQEELDYYWDALSADQSAEQCGWLKDKYGISWQITPTRMDEMMREGTKEQVDRVTQAFLQMKKFDIATLEAAYKGE
jgi:predicted 3-demethylubiquinone-9 3-methyltransferase (glyoxalase superfamily)